MKVQQTAAAGNIAAVPERLYSPNMPYKIQYFRDGKHYTEVYWDGPLPETRETARRGIKRNRAEYAAILDLDHDAKPVEILRPS
jgi:hypothetical protein